MCFDKIYGNIYSFLNYFKIHFQFDKRFWHHKILYSLSEHKSFIHGCRSSSFGNLLWRPCAEYQIVIPVVSLYCPDQIRCPNFKSVHICRRVLFCLWQGVNFLFAVPFVLIYGCCPIQYTRKSKQWKHTQTLTRKRIFKSEWFGKWYVWFGHTN
jgi:hypothetical protein